MNLHAERAPAVRGIVGLAALVVVIYGLQAAKVLLVPFLLAVFLALISIRPLQWLESKRVPAVLAVLLIVLLLLVLLGALGTLVGASIADFTNSLPTYQQRVEAKLAGLTSGLADRINISVQDLVVDLDPGWAMALAVSVLDGVREVLGNLLLIVFTMVFILLEASGFPLKLRAAFGREPAEYRQFRVFTVNLERYLEIKTVVSLGTGLCAGLLTWFVGVDFPVLWGLLAFLLNYVPTIGSIIAAVPAVLFAFMQLGLFEALVVMGGYILINLGFGNLLEPRLMGRGLGLSTLVVFLSLIFWGWVFGPVGMLLSVPLTMTLKIALEGNAETRWLAILLGSERDAERWLPDPAHAAASEHRQADRDA